MTLIELLEASHRQILGRDPSEWQTFGPGCEVIALGRDHHIGTAIVEDASLNVLALELANRWWIDPQYREAYLRELDLQALTLQGQETTEMEILLYLAEITDDTA